MFALVAYVGWMLPGWFDDRRFRLGEVSLDYPNPLGLTREAPFKLTVNLRGCTPDRSRICRGDLRLRVEGPDPQILPGLEQATGPWMFAKRTGRTYAEIGAQGRVAGQARAGSYRLILEARDHVSGARASESVEFQVKP